jgi:AcrR family transcriptional regulator
MGKPKFDDADFLGAALTIAADRGPLAVTVGSITGLLKAPTGSFYHRFPSRDVLLGELWLRAVLDFQQGVAAALNAGDGLRAALHTPGWARQHPEKARLLLLYHRDDFVQGEWPEGLRQRVAEHTRQGGSRIDQFTRLVFGRVGPDQIRSAQFLLAELPVSLVRGHLRRRETPPPIVDELIRVTYRAVVGAYRAA